MWRFCKKTKPTSRRPNRLSRWRKRLEIESLEDRRVLSWGSMPPAVIVPSADAGAVAPLWSVSGSVADDSYEENDFLGQASNLGTLTSRQIIPGLAMADSADYYRFTMPGPGSGVHHVLINFQHSQGDLDLRLYDANGTLLRSSEGTSDNEHISLEGFAAGSYHVQVYGFLGVHNPSYTLDINPGVVVTPTDDSYEENDTLAQSRDLGTLSSRQTIAGLVMADSADWYRFTMPGPGGVLHHVSINFQHSQGDLDLRLYDASGTLQRSSEGTSDNEHISLQGFAAGTYFVHVYGFLGAHNPSYTLDINPGVVVTPTDDSYEENDTLAQSRDLGPVTSPRTIPGLVMADSADWFRFTTNQAGTSTSAVTIYFQQAQGNLDLRLYDANGTQLRSSQGTGDNERVSLDGLAAGTYHIQAYGYQGAHNPSYTLEINPGTGTPGGGGRHTLYLVFDGATITRSDLLRWSADWSEDAQGWRDEYLDAEGDGIVVHPYLAGWDEREQIIARIIELLQEDVQPFGITVQRHTGPVVEGVGATTQFMGDAELSATGFAGIACDIDFDDNNSTDIAFSLEQPPWFGVEDAARTMADLALHEAGHTWGLYHVDSPFTNEAMGLGYSFGTYLGVNAEFRNESFPEYLDHGYGRGPQNTYQVMRRQFVSGGGLTSPHSHGGLAGGHHLDSFDVAGGAIYLGGHSHRHSGRDHHHHGHGHHDHQERAMSPHGHEEELSQDVKGEEHHHGVEEDHEHAVPSGLSEHHRQGKFADLAMFLAGSRSPVKFSFADVVDALFADEEDDAPLGENGVVRSFPVPRRMSIFSEGESIRPDRAADADLLFESILDRLTIL